MLLPIFLSANQPPERFYLGGPAISSFRGSAAVGDRVPEDWVGSTTTVFGETELGLSTLPSGETLRNVIASDPVAWLGSEHLRGFGKDSMILVKLLDAGQRLPVHIHPDGDFAARNLAQLHGKAEAWIILQPGVVHLGFNREVSCEELANWVDTQNTGAILAAMNVVPVRVGDGIFVPPGLPHAIGQGVFLVEVQEPADLSILLEWVGFEIDGATDGHLGLGFEVALEAADRSLWTASEIDALVCRESASSGHALPDLAGRYFRANHIAGSAKRIQAAGFSILIAVAGQGALEARPTADSQPVFSTNVQSGDTILIPHDFGEFWVTGNVEMIRLQPPEVIPIR
ncbi:carbohydrate kinase [Cryobacterium sp. Hh7]|uniref:class I mannose-6-phosphate isomerase n=1 Tax=Cryobacterium sp. Hh7 TaxID=1259159 RepID=UPI00106904C0|nr:class I mannose-6-phosphate isomerase [Cryobacterium sp. Hh7]TFD52676.1 carbohydrate kinase [Cryobacterium sp. Hh7]